MRIFLYGNFHLYHTLISKDLNYPSISVTKCFSFTVHICVTALAAFLVVTNGQNRRQNYVPRGDISNDRDLEEGRSNESRANFPRTTPEVFTL